MAFFLIVGHGPALPVQAQATEEGEEKEEGKEMAGRFASVQFRAYIIDDDFPGGSISQTALFDIVGKPWSPSPNNALGGRAFVLFLENLTP